MNPRFSEGEQVTIRFGIQQGQRATIIKSQPADVYRVKVADGSVLFFSGKGLEKGIEQQFVGRPVQTLQGPPMAQSKTLQQREKELQALLASPEGRKQLQELESNYYAASGRPKAAKTSVITYILVYERARGLIDG